MSKIKSSFSGFVPIQGAPAVAKSDPAKSSSPFEQKPAQAEVDNTLSTTDFTDTRVFNTMDTLIGKVPLEPSEKAGSLANASLSGLNTSTALSSLKSSTSLSTPSFSLLKAEDTPFNTVPSLELSGDQATRELSAMSARGGFSFEKTDSGSVKVALPMFGVKYTDSDLLPAATADSKSFTFPTAADALNTARFSHWASAKGVTEVNHKGFKDHLQEDGIFGPRTQDAVRNFQAENNLPVTGSVGEKTFSMMESVADKLGIRSWFWDDKKPAVEPKAVKPVDAMPVEAAPTQDVKAPVFKAPDQTGAPKTTTHNIFNPPAQAENKAADTGFAKSWQLSSSLNKNLDKKEPTAADVRSGAVEIKRNDTKSTKLVERIQSLLNRIKTRKSNPTVKKEEPVRLNINGFTSEDPATGEKIQRYEYPKYIHNAFSSFRESVQSSYNLREIHKAADHQQSQQVQDDAVRRQEMERFLQNQMNRKL